MSTSHIPVLDWAKKTTSSFAELFVSGTDHAGTETQHERDLIYRLRHWPKLPERYKTADVYRTLSVMSHRPVNRHWILNTSRMNDYQVDALLDYLAAEGDVEVVDPSSF